MATEKRLIDLTPDDCIKKVKRKTNFAKIIVSGTAEKPYYDIMWLDYMDGQYHIGYGSYNLDYVFQWLSECFEIVEAPTVDAVEADDMREFAEDVVHQFGYYCQNGGRLHITHGGLSTLEWAFDILGWENPHPVPEFECEVEGCHEHATCGGLTDDGYKRMCGRHYFKHSNGR